LIVRDDIGLRPVSPDAAERFFCLVDAAYEKRTLAVGSNVHPDGFDELMPKTLATVTAPETTRSLTSSRVIMSLWGHPPSTFANSGSSYAYPRRRWPKR
jgi:DNA replication protein DnaC